MNRPGQDGMSLVEALIAMGVMSLFFATAYGSIHRSLALHRLMSRESVSVVDRCGLAERLTADVRGCRDLRSGGPDHFTVTTSDGALVQYAASSDGLVRTDSKTPGRKFKVGAVHVSLGEPAVAVRLRFPDAELVVAQ
jgi:hypothetical protein